MIFGRIEGRPSGAFAPVSGSYQPVQAATGNTSTTLKPIADTPGAMPPVKPGDGPKS